MRKWHIINVDQAATISVAILLYLGHIPILNLFLTLILFDIRAGPRRKRGRLLDRVAAGLGDLAGSGVQVLLGAVVVRAHEGDDGRAESGLVDLLGLQLRRGHLLQVLHVGGVSLRCQFLHYHVSRYFFFLFLHVFIGSDLLQSLP